MPLELGVFIGAATFGQGQVGEKSLLILDSEPYRYQKFMSDISGQDIVAHGNSTETMISCVRDWLVSESGSAKLPGGAHIAARFEKFNGDLHALCAMARVRFDELTYRDFLIFAADWAAYQQFRQAP
jgi:hypothetical protein